MSQGIVIRTKEFCLTQPFYLWKKVYPLFPFLNLAITIIRSVSYSKLLKEHIHASILIIFKKFFNEYMSNNR